MTSTKIAQKPILIVDTKAWKGTGYYYDKV